MHLFINLRLIESMIELRPRQGNLRLVFRLFSLMQGILNIGIPKKKSIRDKWKINGFKLKTGLLFRCGVGGRVCFPAKAYVTCIGKGVRIYSTNQWTNITGIIISLADRCWHYVNKKQNDTVEVHTLYKSPPLS